MGYFTCKNISAYQYNPLSSQSIQGISSAFLNNELKDILNFDLERSSLPNQLAQLLRLRLAIHSKCPFYNWLHRNIANELAAENDLVNNDKLNHLPNWHCYRQYYNPAEQSALTFIDAIVDGLPDDYDELYDDLSSHFTDKAIKAINQIVLNYKTLSYLKASQHYISLNSRTTYKIQQAANDTVQEKVPA